MIDCELWHVVQTRPSKECLASQHLERQGFKTFLPRLKTRKRRRNGKYETVLRPMFPGYVFIAFDLDTVRWQAIDSTFGVNRLVRFGDRPARLKEGLVERIQQLSSAGYVAFNDELAPADQVRILTGPFDDWIGEVVRLAEHNRAVVLLKMATRSVEIEVSREGLVRAA